MTETNPQLAYLRDQRLAAHALSPAPVWLWSTDAEHILWANPALDAERLACEASLNRAVEGEISVRQISMLKLGAGSTFTLLAVFAEPAETSAVGFRGD